MLKRSCICCLLMACLNPLVAVQFLIHPAAR